MTLRNQVFSVTTSATEVMNVNDPSLPVCFHSAGGVQVYVEIDNVLGTETVYWGGAGVTTANGGVIPAGSKEAPNLCPTDRLYLVAAAATTVRIIAGRQ